MKKLALSFAVLGLISVIAAPRVVAAQGGDEVDLGNRLAAVLRAGRGVVSSSQGLINDPSVVDKGLTGEVFRAMVIEAYVAQYGVPPLTDDLSPEERQLTESQLASMTEVINENQSVINAEGLAFKGFIPAIFARLVNEKFADKMASQASVKVTAPIDKVRNRKARPDQWENDVIESKFKSDGWSKGEAFSEDVLVGGKPAFRMLIPEYYSTSCLACHGSPAGETDITGFPKEGGSEGELGGAISITLFK